MNLTRLVVLWLLSESRLHGYQIKRILSDPTLQFWFPIEYASIYSVLRFLEKAGYTRSLAVERQGNRPERTRYAITSKGRRYLQQLLRDAWSRPALPTQPIDVALAARAELPEEDVPPLLDARRDSLFERLQFLDQVGRSAPAAEMVSRAKAMTAAELRWLDDVREGRQSGTEISSQEGVEVVQSTQTQPAVQLIANLVVTRPDGQVLFVKYDPEDERWWLPGEDLEPFEHPDERARQILAGFAGLTINSMEMRDIESFRGRRGWHVVFHYLVHAEGDPTSKYPMEWFATTELPRTMHGRWEHDAVKRLTG